MSKRHLTFSEIIGVIMNQWEDENKLWVEMHVSYCRSCKEQVIAEAQRNEISIRNASWIYD